jgi:hypothetical protein
MDDAMILSCGHSYGSNGMQHIYRMVCPRILLSHDSFHTFASGLLSFSLQFTSSMGSCLSIHLCIDSIWIFFKLILLDWL